MARKKKKLNIATLLLIVVILIVIRFVEDIEKDIPPIERFRVIKVADGDTFTLQGGDKVRLLSIDTPEKGELYYDEAKIFLEKLTLNKYVQLEYADRRRDGYGRLLAYVYVDSIFVNKQILDNGLGYMYLFKDTDSDYEQTKQLLDAQNHAINAHENIWSLRYTAEEYYVNKDGSYRLHRPGCNSVSKLTPGKYQTFENRIDGFKLGLSPCRNCKP